MYELRRAAPQHTFGIHSSELSALPAGSGQGFEGTIELPVSRSSEVRELLVDESRLASFDARIARCGKGTCWCWEAAFRSTCRQVANDLEQYAVRGAWVLTQDGRVGGVESLGSGLPHHLGPSEGDGPADIVVTFEPQTGDGTVSIGERSVGIHAIPERAVGLLWWIADAADLALARSERPGIVELLTVAVLADGVSSRVRLAEAMTWLAPVLDDAQLMGQAHDLLAAGWDASLSALAQAVVVANLPTMASAG
jgi:hypothetical protein